MTKRLRAGNDYSAGECRNPFQKKFRGVCGLRAGQIDKNGARPVGNANAREPFLTHAIAGRHEFDKDAAE